MSETAKLRALLRGLPVFDTTLPEFDPLNSPATPARLFVAWLCEAIEAGVCEPHAMTLSTVGVDGRPNSRVLILKGVEGDAWQFASSVASTKGQEIGANASAALAFYWPVLGRQVRIRGTVSTADGDVSAADFVGRGVTGRAHALLARQSQPLADVDGARAEHAAAVRRIESEPDLIADHWALYGVDADEVEFFQARADRWHTRLRYQRTDADWEKHELWP